ncbi:MAG: GNAT family N-acetyltransferase [Candidatus Saccharibacteria bacterium]
MKKHTLDFTAEKINEFSKIRKVFVALNDAMPIGISCATKDIYGYDNDYVILIVFILPELHGKSIGAKLIRKCEEYIKSVNGINITIPASINAHEFYKKLGYDYINSNKTPNENNCIMMTKLI